MTLTVFAAICILGCDLLIYFLFHWTLGERGRTKRRRGGHKRRLSEGQETELLRLRRSGQKAAERSKVVPYRKTVVPTRFLASDGEPACQQVTEEMAHRRRVAAFAISK